MKLIIDKQTGKRKAIVDVSIDIDTKNFTFEITEGAFSFLLRREATESLRDAVKHELVTKVYAEVQKETYKKLIQEFESEWRAVELVFPEAIEQEEPLDFYTSLETKAKKQFKKERSIRCSRQLSAEELEELRKKLLEQMQL